MVGQITAGQIAEDLRQLVFDYRVNWSEERDITTRAGGAVGEIVGFEHLDVSVSKAKIATAFGFDASAFAAAAVTAVIKDRRHEQIARAAESDAEITEESLARVVSHGRQICVAGFF